MKNIFLLITGALLFVSYRSDAQFAADTSANNPSMATALSYYINSIGINAAIYAGSENPNPRYPVNDGFPFFEQESAVNGEILYDGVLYKNVPMWYDLVRNEVAVQHPKRNARIALNSNKVEYFALGSEYFIRPERDSEDSELMPSAFYHVLHDGETLLLARYTKQMSEIIKESQYVTNYTKQRGEYFLKQDGRYYPVKNLKALLNHVDDKRQEVQQHLREYRQNLKSNNLRVKPSQTQLMVSALAYYEKISQ
jgi:hypothetical protein